MNQKKCCEEIVFLKQALKTPLIAQSRVFLCLLSPILAIALPKVYNISMDLLKKLIYQSWHRGTRENDLLLGPFADAVLPNLSETDLQAYQDMLNHDDADLFAWITGQYPIPEIESMVRRIRDFHQCR